MLAFQRAVRAGPNEEMTLEQTLEGEMAGAVWVSERKAFQAEIPHVQRS